MSPKEETIARLREQIETKVDDEVPADVPFPEVGRDAEETAVVEEEDAAAEEVGEDAQDEEASEPKSSTREYIVFCQKPKQEQWLMVDRKVSSTAEAAVRALGEDGLEDGATYAAVPARNWSQLPPVSKSTITTISFK